MNRFFDTARRAFKDACSRSQLLAKHVIARVHVRREDRLTQDGTISQGSWNIFSKNFAFALFALLAV
jgi:hypothetical protein